LDLLVHETAREEPKGAIRIPVRGEDPAPAASAAPEAPGGPEEEPADPAQVEALLRQIELLEQDLHQLKAQ
jgi:hypothetical protein